MLDWRECTWTSAGEKGLLKSSAVGGGGGVNASIVRVTVYKKAAVSSISNIFENNPFGTAGQGKWKLALHCSSCMRGSSKVNREKEASIEKGSASI
jgi:hypothetical protein